MTGRIDEDEIKRKLDIWCREAMAEAEAEGAGDAYERTNEGFDQFCERLGVPMRMKDLTDFKPLKDEGWGPELMKKPPTVDELLNRYKLERDPRRR